VLITAGTAGFGIVCFMALASTAKPFEPHRWHAAIRYLGVRTLPIYAMHLHFFGMVHNFLAIPLAVAVSLGVDLLLQRNRWTRLLLLGETSRSRDSTAGNASVHDQQMAAGENR